MSIFQIAAFIGLLLPLLCLALCWRRSGLRTFYLLFIGWQLLQIGSERLLSTNELGHWIKYTASAFVLVRLIHLFRFSRVTGPLASAHFLVRLFIALTWLANLGFWAYVLWRLASRIVDVF